MVLVNMLKFFNYIESDMKERASSKDVDISFEISNIKDQYTALTLLDGNRLENVLTNVITYAIGLTSSGGEVKASLEQVDSSGEYGRYKFTISAVNSARADDAGFSNIKKHIDTMGGEISCSNEKDNISTFTIYLPFKIEKV